jgi:hypothetical protein
MRALWAHIKREPVRWFAGANGLVPILTTGLILFDWWHPTVEQLAYVNGLPAAVGVAVGVSVLRNAVTPVA